MLQKEKAYIRTALSVHPDLANNLCKLDFSIFGQRQFTSAPSYKPFLLNHELGRAIISLTCNQFQKPKAHCCKPNLSPSNKHTSLHLKAEVQSYYSLCWLLPLMFILLVRATPLASWIKENIHTNQYPVQQGHS